MKIIRTLSLIFFLTIVHTLSAQENEQDQLKKRVDNLKKVVGKLDNFTLSGYFQGQYIYGEKDATLRLGSPNENKDESFSRIGIRRSRIKVTYEEGIGSAVFQLDFSERGIIIRDAYLKFRDPWLKTSYVQGGIFFRPFGHEVRYSSSRREAPERSRVVQKLFPNERDLGAMIQLQAPKSSPLSIFTLEAALIAGNGVIQETDSKRDFIGHLNFTPDLGKDAYLSLGTSYYNGSVYQGSENVYTMQNGGFVANTNSSNKGAYAKREYVGFELVSNFKTQLGRTQLRSEYIFGQQPASKTTSGSPNSAQRPTYDTFIRDFQGGYAIFVQDIGKLPFAGIVRYDWYDPNTKVASDKIGLNNNNTTETDLAHAAWGLGCMWRAKKNLELTAYYDFNKNETSKNVVGWENDRKDNIFTVSLLYRY